MAEEKTSGQSDNQAHREQLQALKQPAWAVLEGEKKAYRFE
jgi:hypothetical protein